MRVKVDFGSRAQREIAARRKASEPHKYAPGPKLPACEECPEFGCYGWHDEHWCPKHAPAELKRPGDFLESPRS